MVFNLVNFCSLLGPSATNVGALNSIALQYQPKPEVKIRDSYSDLETRIVSWREASLLKESISKFTGYIKEESSSVKKVQERG